MSNEEILAEELADTDLNEQVEELVEEEEEDTAESLDSLTDEEAPEQPEEQRAEPQGTGDREPGYVQKRIDRALARERASIIEQVKAEMEAQYAPIRERLLEADAKEMVRRGEVKDIETAKELLRYRQGQAPQAAQPEQAPQPRNERGQFSSSNQLDAQTSERIDRLAEQADAIKAMTGIDVIDVFSKDEEIKAKVTSGEMDFIELAKQLQKEQEQPKRHPPAPTRSPNGASGSSNPNAISSMSDEQFERMERRIKEGARYSLK